MLHNGDHAHNFLAVVDFQLDLSAFLSLHCIRYRIDVVSKNSNVGPGRDKNPSDDGFEMVQDNA